MTGAGIVFRAALLVAIAAAFLLANNLLFLIVAAMFSTLLISGFVTRLGLGRSGAGSGAARNTSRRAAKSAPESG